jgi:hypothetical protein
MGLSFSSRIDAVGESQKKKPSEYGELVPYPFAPVGPRRFLRAPSEEKVAG